MVFGALFVTYVVVASLIAFFTVKIVGIPIGKKMFTKIVISIVAFIPLYLLLAYLLSRFVSRDLTRLEESVREFPFTKESGGSFIREIDRLGEVIKLQSERIKAMVEAQRFMLYRIAHDIRTPLTNIKNVMEAIRDGVVGESERDTYMEKVVEEVDKATAFLEEALSNLKRVNRDTPKEEIEVCSFVENLLPLWRLNFQTKGISVVIRCDRDVKLLMPPIDLEEILNNILLNVLKHTSATEIRVDVYKEGGKVFLRIRDNGEGFDKAKIKDSYRKGSLGLYIVRELVWKNGGQIDISSGEEGTEVVIAFRSA